MEWRCIQRCSTRASPLSTSLWSTCATMSPLPRFLVGLPPLLGPVLYLPSASELQGFTVGPWHVCEDVWNVSTRIGVPGHLRKAPGAARGIPGAVGKAQTLSGVTIGFPPHRSRFADVTSQYSKVPRFMGALK
jgi:hypothetical protein